MSNVSDFPKQRAVQPFEAFSPTEWHGRTPPPYDWIVDGCFLRSTVAILSGDGGLGKSLLMQQLCTAAAIGRPWLGLATKPCRTFAFFCEDDKDELHRRQEAINRHYGIGHADLSGVQYISRVGMENVLMEFDRRTDHPRPTPLFGQLRHAVKEFGAQIVVLDTLADTFAGNEIIRNQVRRFCTALRRLAVEIQGVVIMTSHPSNAGLNSGSGISGSTAWNNSVRSRLYLTSVRNKDGEEDNTNERYLKTMKNNQGPYGGKMKLLWADGVFVPEAPHEIGPGNSVDAIDLRVSVLKAIAQLCRSGTRMSPDKFARTYVVGAVKNHPMGRRFTRGQIESAKDALLADGKLEIVTVRRDRKDKIYIRPADMRLPEEGKPE